ncbi:hypothetical protein K3495_g5878 [Podosphaera aphanis]|nr:hypothetical protein K3495_g5878 [Podosphaera aphanis]
MRLVNIIEHYGINIVFRKGKANVLADYLSLPDESTFKSSENLDFWQTVLDNTKPSVENLTNKPQPILRLDVLSRVDSQAIFEFLSTKEPLPARLSDPWVARNFSIHDSELYFLLHQPTTTIGEPPTKPGAITMLKPLTRWAIDHTRPGDPNHHLLLNAIEYAKEWIVSRIVPNTKFEYIFPLFLYTGNTLGTPKEYISDNHCAFVREAVSNWHKARGTTAIKITPQRPRGNGKVEQANGILKNILNRLVLDMAEMTYSTIIDRAVSIYNRRVGPYGYSSHFLMFGTKPPHEQLIYRIYNREPTFEEDEIFAEDPIKLNAAPLARSYVASLKCARYTVRALTQENKALVRVFAAGDWALRVTSRNHKHEPYYDGPWPITSCHQNNTYSLSSPGGVNLANKYNGSNLFPAYVKDGHPVQSLWYGSKYLLQKDGAKILALAS